jgi:DNA-binding transcriptional MerR regulator
MEENRFYTIIDISRLLKLPLSRVRVLARIHASKIPSEVREGERVYPLSSVEAFRELVLQSPQSASGMPDEAGGATTQTAAIDAVFGEEAEEPPADAPLYYSVSKISQMTGIPESKVLEYRRRFPQRIPSMGEGKDRVHPTESIEIFQAIHRQQTGEAVRMREGRRHYDLQEVSRLLNLSRSLLYAYISEEGDRIPKFKEGKRWLFPEEALTRFREIRAEREARKRRKVEGLYSIRDIARKTGVSESTLHQYKRILGEKIPSIGKGRNRRYPEEAIQAFLDYRETGGGRKVPGSYSLSEVAKTTGIPEHTLLYYRRTYPDEIPVARDRSTRIYTDESIEAFKQIKSRASRRGGRRGGGDRSRLVESLEQRVQDLERVQRETRDLVEQIYRRLDG